ncbi:MAG: hypothetical protein M3R17_00920 [Bacteroidota bacterium]|nr:hypothetical protein [Bacteroidota bacterium]
MTCEIDSLLPDTLSLKISSYYFNDTVITKIIINNNSTTTLKVNYPPYCEYDKSTHDKICPVCHKKDKVIPIVYGLLIYTGEPGKEDEEDEIYSGGCEITGCDPHWHCKRDNKDF